MGSSPVAIKFVSYFGAGALFFFKSSSINNTQREKLKWQLNTEIYEDWIFGARDCCLYNQLKFHNFIEL